MACHYVLRRAKRLIENGEVQIHLVELSRRDGSFFLDDVRVEIPGVPATVVGDKVIVGDGVIDLIEDDQDMIEMIKEARV